MQKAMNHDDDLRMAIYADADLGEILACLDAGAGVNLNVGHGSTPLLEAQSPEMARALLERGADIHAEDDMGRGIFHSLAYASHPHDMARLFQECGADLEVRDEDGRTPLLHCLSYMQGMEDTHMALLDIGANVLAVDAQGNNALHCWAMGHAYIGIGERLIELGVDPAARNRLGRSVSDFLNDELHGEHIQAAIALQSHFDLIELEHATPHVAISSAPRRV